METDDVLQQFRRWMAITYHQHPISGGNGRLMYRCPAHDDTHRSLSVRLSHNGELDFHCFAGCPRELVVATLGWQWNGNGKQSHEHGKPREERVDMLTGRALLHKAWERTERCPLTETAMRYLQGRRIPYGAGRIRSSEPVWESLLELTDKETLTRCGLARQDKRGSLKPVSALAPDRILIPYYRTGRIVHLRSRTVKHDNSGARYCGLPGWGSEVYIADAPQDSTVLVVEGELKALTLRYYGGFYAIGVAGVQNAHGKVESLCRNRRLKAIILFDTEIQKPSVAESAHKLRNRLKRAGVAAQVAWLRDTQIEGRIAPDDYLLQYGLFRFLQALQLDNEEG